MVPACPLRCTPPRPPRPSSCTPARRADVGPAAQRADHDGVDVVAGGDLEYGRYGNPTWSAFEDARRAGGRPCLTFSSGLAAVSTVLDLVGNGRTVVAPRHAYNGTICSWPTSRRAAGCRPAGGRHRHRRVVTACDDAAWSGSSRRPTRRSRSPTSTRSRRPPTRPGRTSSSTTPSPLPCCNGRSSTAPTSSCTRRRSSSPATATCCSARSTRDDELYAVLKDGATWWARSPARWRRGWRCAACAPCTSRSSGRRPTRRARAAAAGAPRDRRGPLPRVGAIVSVVLAAAPLAADLLTLKTRLVGARQPRRRRVDVRAPPPLEDRAATIPRASSGSPSASRTSTTSGPTSCRPRRLLPHPPPRSHVALWPTA